MVIDATSTVVRTEGMMTTPVDEDIVILNMPKNNYVSLDRIGRRIWELLETPITVALICDNLVAEFAGEREQIETDVFAFLSELSAEGLVRITH